MMRLRKLLLQLQVRQPAVVRGLFVGVGEPQQRAIGPAWARDLKPEGKSLGVEAARYRDRRNAQAIDPAGLAVWPGLRGAGRGLVEGGNLQRRIDEAIEPEPLQRSVVEVERRLLRTEEVLLR